MAEQEKSGGKPSATAKAVENPKIISVRVRGTRGRLQVNDAVAPNIVTNDGKLSREDIFAAGRLLTEPGLYEIEADGKLVAVATIVDDKWSVDFHPNSKNHEVVTFDMGATKRPAKKVNGNLIPSDKLDGGPALLKVFGDIVAKLWPSMKQTSRAGGPARASASSQMTKLLEMAWEVAELSGKPFAEIIERQSIKVDTEKLAAFVASKEAATEKQPA